MKKVISSLFLSLALSLTTLSFAETMVVPDYEALGDSFAKYMAAVQECQGKVDKDKLAKFIRESEVNDQKVRALCLEDRDKAEALDEQISRDMLKDPDFKAMMECISEISVDNSPFGNDEAEDDEESFSHVCD